MSVRPPLAFRPGVPQNAPVIRVDSDMRYQRVTGVGAAMTDTSAWLLYDELPAAARAHVMAQLFGTSGIHLGAMRILIAASDFTHNGRPYSYDDLPPGESDPTLSRFSVAHDEAYIIPALREMLNDNPAVWTIAAPWSPPPWMKRNDAFSNPGQRGKLRAGAYPLLAAYLVRFVEAYRSHGIAVDAITPQNEPGQPTSYPGLTLSEQDEGRFLAGYLAPAVRAAGLDVKLYAHDYKWLLFAKVAKLVAEGAVRSVLAGIAWHCYEGNPDAMSELHAQAPELDEVESECSGGLVNGPSAEAMIASFRNWASVVLLWNLALDPRGGPVEPPNSGCPHCTGVVTVDERTHTVSYTVDYYQLGQFSRFVSPGAYRIASNTFVTYNSPTLRHQVKWATPGVDNVAFTNPDGSKVLLALNNAPTTQRFAVAWEGRSFTYALPPGATVTFRWS